MFDLYNLAVGNVGRGFTAVVHKVAVAQPRAAGGNLRL